MLKRYHQIVGGFFRIIDVCVIGSVWIGAYWFRFYVPIVQVTKGFPRFSTYAALTPLVIGLWATVFSWFQVYGSNRILRRTDEIFLLLKAHATAMLCFLSLTYLFSEYRYSRGVMIVFGISGLIGLLSTRLILRNFIRTLRLRGFQQKLVLFIGDGKPLTTLSERLKKFPELGLTVKSHLTAVDFESVKRHLKENHFDQIVISLSSSQGPALPTLLESLRNEIVDVVIIPELYDFVTLGCEIEDFDGLPMVNLNDSPLEGWGAIGKRLTDFVLSLIGVLVISPILVLIALLIKLTSRGPIFYSQIRMGLDGRTFKMLKFRSMKVGAESETGAVWATKNDDRKTWFGSFLRKTSLDELPQLFNVIKGEMSLVGPRPERPVFVDQFKDQVPLYMLRHKVKAGMTGWAQVNGWRGDTSLDRRIECDLYYIRNWSYSLDIKILFLTLWRGFIHKNAY